MKINWTKTMGIAGTVLSITATILSGKAQEKNMAKTIEDEVKKQLDRRG